MSASTQTAITNRRTRMYIGPPAATASASSVLETAVRRPPSSEKHATRRAAKALKARAQLGVGLVEILVAVLVFSIGLLGVAMLQAKSLSTNNSAMARSMATMYSYSIIDAMRIDSANLSSYAGTVTASSCPDASTSLASAQLHQWCSSLAVSLGAVSTTTGTIQCDGNKLCTITIVFDDSRGGIGGSQNQTVVTKVAL